MKDWPLVQFLVDEFPKLFESKLIKCPLEQQVDLQRKDDVGKTVRDYAFKNVIDFMKEETDAKRNRLAVLQQANKEVDSALQKVKEWDEFVKSIPLEEAKDCKKS